MPMTFDTYNKCSYNCLYCFSYFQRSLKKENYQTESLCSVDIERIKKMFTMSMGSPSEFYSMIKTKVPLQWGGLSDQFDEYERQNGVTLKLMKFFKEIDYPICFSTKATWVFDDPRYTSLIEGQKNWNFKISIINLDAELSKKVEKGVDGPQKRLQALKKITELNCGGATLRLRPFIMGMSDKDYLQLIQEAINNSATAVSTEFLCIEGRADARLKARYGEMSHALGIDILDYYQKLSQAKSGYMRLSRELKLNYFYKMKELCDKNNIRFYVSDAHGKELCHNGSCCGLNKEWGYSRGQITEALLMAKENGEVYFSDIEKNIEYMKTIKLNNPMNLGGAEGQAKFKGWSVHDYFKYLWNSPNEKRSPYKYFGGVLKPTGLDKENNVIYSFQKR